MRVLNALYTTGLVLAGVCVGVTALIVLLQIGGRLAAMAGGLLQPVAEKNATAFIEALKREMATTP